MSVVLCGRSKLILLARHSTERPPLAAASSIARSVAPSQPSIERAMDK